MKTLQSKKLFTIMIIVSSITCFCACKKTYDKIATPIPPTGTSVTASVAGRVTDLNNLPVSNASVAAGTSTTITDVDGLFTIKNTQLNTDAGFVTITKPGYFTGSRTFLVSTNTVNNVKIQLIPKTVSGTFDAVSGGNITVSGGGSVNFGGNNIVNASNGAAYAGNISVSTFYLNPADANFNEYMPGDLRGLNASNQPKILQSFGMVLVQLNDANGGKLQIAGGKTATITIPIPSALQTNAPGMLPLWYFNDTTGIWKQQGSAIKQGNNYVGTVAHFSFWTAGQLGQSVRLDATFAVDTSSAIALANKLVAITSLNYGTTNGYTDNTGTVSGLVPANETLVMEVFNDCGDSIYRQNIGPFNADANLGTIKISAGSGWYYPLSNITITGTAINCGNASVANGTVQITSGSTQYASPINNGSFSLTFSRCSNSSTPLSLIVMDAATGLSSNPQTINISAGTMSVGQISVCNSATANFTYNAQGAAVPVTVTFTNTSTNAVSYLWDFGDPASGVLNTSTLQNPSHVYATAGNYTVKLSATGNGTTNNITQAISITGTSGSTDSSFINLTMNGTTFQWAYPDSIQAAHTDTANNTLITGQNVNSIYFYILNDNTSPGTYGITLSATLSGISYPNNNATTTVTEYGAVGGYVIGTSSGQMMAADSTTSIPFTTTYKVKRKY